MPVGQHTRARPQKQQQQQARMGEPTRVIVLIRLGRGRKGVNKAPPSNISREFEKRLRAGQAGQWMK
jgi:hypothetical protein